VPRALAAAGAAGRPGDEWLAAIRLRHSTVLQCKTGMIGSHRHVMEDLHSPKGGLLYVLLCASGARSAGAGAGWA